MPAAVQYIEARRGKQIRRLLDERGVKRKPMVVRRRAGNGERNAKNRIRAKAALVRGSVQIAELFVQTFLFVCIESADGALNFTLDVTLCLQNTFAAVTSLVSVAQFHGLAFAGGCA
jgi:hypothetical protein